MNFDIFHIQSRLVDERKQQCTAYNGLYSVLFMAVPVLYLFVCALFSLGKYKNPYPAAKTDHRFLVVFTVLRNGKEVIESINHFLDTQHYPRENTTLPLPPPNCPKQTC